MGGHPTTHFSLFFPFYPQFFSTGLVQLEHRWSSTQILLDHLLCGVPPRFDSGPRLIPGSWIMMRHVSCILLLEWSTTSQRLWVYRISVPYAQKDPRFLFEKRRGQPREFWSLVSTIDGSTLPQVGVEELLSGTPSTW